MAVVKAERLMKHRTSFQFPVLQDRECESRLFEGWRETTHWREFTVNSPRAEGEFKGGRK
jgi:hypothetical protein